MQRGSRIEMELLDREPVDFRKSIDHVKVIVEQAAPLRGACRSLNVK